MSEYDRETAIVIDGLAKIAKIATAGKDITSQQWLEQLKQRRSDKPDLGEIVDMAIDHLDRLESLTPPDGLNI